MQSQFTRQDVLEAAQAVAIAHPDRRNPTDVHGEICAYTHHTDPDWHYYAGSILVALDCALPAEPKKVDLTPDRDRFTHEAMGHLINLQAYAETRKRDEFDMIIPDVPPLYTFAQVWEWIGDREQSNDNTEVTE